MAEGVANLTTLPTGIAKLGYRIVRQGIAKGIAILTSLPTGWKK